jgi:hypothetical protein
MPRHVTRLDDTRGRVLVLGSDDDAWHANHARRVFVGIMLLPERADAMLLRSGVLRTAAREGGRRCRHMRRSPSPLLAVRDWTARGGGAVVQQTMRARPGRLGPDDDRCRGAIVKRQSEQS